MGAWVVRAPVMALCVLMQMFLWIPPAQSQPDYVPPPLPPLELLIAAVASVVFIAIAPRRKWLWYVVVGVALFLVTMCMSILTSYFDWDLMDLQ